MTIGVYTITNIKTSEVYVGSSKNIERRFLDHKSKLNNNCHHSQKLQKAWDEYGESSFVFSLLQEVEESINLTEVEQQFIDQYKAWQDYNSQKIAIRTDVKDFTNPYHCDRPMRRNGKQAKSGAIQYRCKCGFTCTDGDRPAHRPLLGDEPLSQVERNRRYRAKLKAEKC